MVTIYHNIECSKSNAALDLLKEKNIEFTLRNYIADPLTKDELKDLLKKLNLPASGIVRKNDALFIVLFSHKDYTETEWLDVLSENPKLIERPIVVNGNKAVIARPAEKLLTIL